MLVKGMLLEVVSLPVLLIPERSEAIGDSVPDVLQSTTSSSSSSTLQVGTLTQF